TDLSHGRGKRACRAKRSLNLAQRAFDGGHGHGHGLCPFSETSFFPELSSLIAAALPVVDIAYSIRAQHLNIRDAQ
ncbi:unnamed protein product, partial [Mycena citricolor]